MGFKHGVIWDLWGQIKALILMCGKWSVASNFSAYIDKEEEEERYRDKRRELLLDRNGSTLVRRVG